MAAAPNSRTLARNLWRQRYAIHHKWVPQTSPFSSSAPAVSTVSQQEQGKEGSSSWSNSFLFVPGAITFGLGTWQVFRRQEKREILDHRQNRLGMEPLTGSEILNSVRNLDLLEFRRVKCQGFFDDKKSIYVGPRSRSISGVTENGYYLITPLIPVPGDPKSAQSPILVNRGWVPRNWRDKALDASQNDQDPLNSPSTLPQENAKNSWWHFWAKKPTILKDHPPAIIPVEVIGVIRGSEKPSIFVPPNDESIHQWFYVDVPALARACGLSEKTLYIEDVNENINLSSPYPIPKGADALIRSSVMPQDHLNYMLTWYSLSAAVTFMAIKRLKPKRIRR